jgi:transposase
MYSKIQQEKTQGFSREAVAKHMGLSWRTVDRYWDMTIEEYETMHKKQYSSALSKRESVILDWLERFPDLSSAQVQDWIQENYDEVYPARTVRNYIRNLRIRHSIEKTNHKEREYGCIPELPPGQQLQADFGEYWAIRQDKARIKLFFVAFILAHSRYKYVLWQIRPFNAIDFVRSLESCFEEFGGFASELVVDQDSLMTVSENFGDIIHTYEFERCKNRHGFSVWLCRKADPQSKGMVESCVKFIKYNFARNRYFYSMDTWSEDCKNWLIRTGNGKKHEETKKIPAEVFVLEKKHLKPVISLANHVAIPDMIATPVRKNNTVRYKSSRYTVPFGTYTRCQSVNLREADKYIEIYDQSEQLLARHELASTPGELVRNNNHARDTSDSIKQLMDETKTALGDTAVAELFLANVQRKRGRYIRDQLRLILTVSKQYSREVIRLALLSCKENNLDSANDFRDFAEHVFRQITVDEIIAAPTIRLMSDYPRPETDSVKVIQCAPSSYMRLVKKGGK